MREPVSRVVPDYEYEHDWEPGPLVLVLSFGGARNRRTAQNLNRQVPSNTTLGPRAGTGIARASRLRGVQERTCISRKGHRRACPAWSRGHPANRAPQAMFSPRTVPSPPAAAPCGREWTGGVASSQLTTAPGRASRPVAFFQDVSPFLHSSTSTDSTLVLVLSFSGARNRRTAQNLNRPALSGLTLGLRAGRNIARTSRLRLRARARL